ncbi:MAG: DUF885 domain-containing protein [Proteobacteria bacterium]|nr:DUF885 domain-containing protein [Pseudomonadota bacterium]
MTAAQWAWAGFAVLLTIGTAEGAAHATEGLSARVDRVADEYYRAVLDDHPEQAYAAGVTPAHHDRLTDLSLAAQRSWERREDRWLVTLHRTDAHSLAGTPQWTTYGILVEQLEAAVDLRVCRLERWASVNHMDSWHLVLASIAQVQPVATATERADAITRWRSVPGLIRQDIANLRFGLAQGYSAPRSVGERMLQQLDGLIATPLERHPYASPFTRSDDAVFKAAYLTALSRRVLPALREYRAFLANEYLPKARQTLAVSELPNGTRCYAALLRSNTTLRRSADEVYARGEAAVARYRDEVRGIGRTAFGSDDFAALAVRGNASADNQFSDGAELLEASREMVDRAARQMPRYFTWIPDQKVVVEPIPAYRDGAGVSPHYEPPTEGGRPGTYWVSLLRPGGTTRAEAEITAFHETWPGHHLQMSYAQRVRGLHPVAQLLGNAGFSEGWARYAESLAEEAGLYQTAYARIQRRTWSARGMVIDPGIHIRGWTREQAISFAMESGRFPRPAAEALVDRVAALPGQLTAYDSGGQEFLDLRREAEAALGPRFDLPQFHDALLESGNITLPMLRAHVEAWINRRQVTGGCTHEPDVCAH